MTTLLTSHDRLEAVDRQLGDLKDLFLEALERVGDAPEVDDALAGRLAELDQRLQKLRRDLEPDDLDPEQRANLLDALHSVRDLLPGPDQPLNLDTADRLLVAIERVRHVLRDALDEYVTGARQDTGLLLRELRERLPAASQLRLAELVGVHDRTLRRWEQTAATPTQRLALVARLVAILRHTWTDAGAIAWFDRPHPLLGGRRPATLLADPAAAPALIDAARSSRSQYAA